MTDTKTASQVRIPKARDERKDRFDVDRAYSQGWNACRVAILAQQAATPAVAENDEGWRLIEVRNLGPLIDALDRAESKGYMPDCMEDEWSDFAFRPAAHAALAQQPAKSAVPAGERETISKALGEILGVMHRSGFEFDRDAPLVNEANRWIEWQANAAQPRQGVELTDEIRSVLVAVRANGYACYLASGVKSSQEFMNRIDAILRATNDTGASNGN